MSRVYQCDSCGKAEELPTIAVEYISESDRDMASDDNEDNDVENDDDEWTEERHFCSFACLSQWSFAQSLETQPI